jgi:hypothetical protein
MRLSFLITAAAVTCAACSSESVSRTAPSANTMTRCTANATQACSCASGTGTQACSAAGTWGSCQCMAAPPADHDNPGITTPIFDAGPVVQEPTKNDCTPGLYLGTYSCDVAIFGLPFPLAGDVSFNLSINETTVDQECADGEEFCADLVISENGGTLFGFAGLIGFETMLEGALDCTTGEFRASGIGGRYGNAISTDPNDPDALWTVEDPPFGMFDGELNGMHAKGTGETIAGEWTLRETVMDIACDGPFTVTLQP